ncbi:alpha/beta hydrolase (plasmid) [Rhodococcus opacus]|uniref:alpha/beta fold hydrolase n=1 Tax=Rhodococcus opacus TaxID=37919 RepID=UPI0034D30A37
MTAAHVQVGTGDRKVICLHGWFGSSTGWGNWPELLDGSRFTYVFVDYRGYGERKDVDGEHTMAEISADVLALADDLGWDTFDIIGHSMGGMAAQRVLADAPHRVQGLVAISPAPATGVPLDDQSWALFADAASVDANRAIIIDFSTGNRLSRTWVDQVVAHSVERSDRAAFGDYLTAWTKTDFADEIVGKEHPIKVIVGEHDPVLGAQAMEHTFMQHYPNASLEVVPNAGHYAMFETPVALATSVEAFLAG